MAQIRLIVFAFFFFGSYLEANIEVFFKKYSLPIYQDILVGNQVVALGTDLCEPRYQMLRPILDLYDRPFTVFDLGAAQGYFSFKIAHDYPQSYCVMVDANTTSYHAYTQHGDMLYDLCHLNNHLSNFCYLNKAITIVDLDYFNQNEHFDVVLALLVTHLMYDNLPDQIQVIERLLQLGDNVIIEVANEVAVPLTSYVESLSQKVSCEFLGEISRHRNPKSSSTGRLFWFKSKIISKPPAIKKNTFKLMNGVYP